MKANIESFLNFCDASNRGCRDLWESLVREKARLGESSFKTEGVDIEFEHHGLVTTINSCCKIRGTGFEPHKATCEAEV